MCVTDIWRSLPTNPDIWCPSLLAPNLSDIIPWNFRDWLQQMWYVSLPYYSNSDLEQRSRWQGHSFWKHVDDSYSKAMYPIRLKLGTDITRGGDFTYMPVLMTSFPLRWDNCHINSTIVRKHTDDSISNSTYCIKAEIWPTVDALITRRVEALP